MYSAWSIVYLLFHPASDAEIKGALNLLSMKVKGKYNSQASIATDFGKVSYTTTDLLRVLSDKTYSLDTSNPIVREAIAKGSTLFVISTLYEAEHSSISVKLVDSESETAEGDAKVAKVGGEVDETVTHTDTYFQGRPSHHDIQLHDCIHITAKRFCYFACLVVIVLF